jgi:hypothetical protein
MIASHQNERFKQLIQLRDWSKFSERNTSKTKSTAETRIKNQQKLSNDEETYWKYDWL